MITEQEAIDMGFTDCNIYTREGRLSQYMCECGGDLAVLLSIDNDGVAVAIYDQVMEGIVFTYFWEKEDIQQLINTLNLQ